jgi:uncharacterized protein YdhG (YjbR/CyaY superfamily)
MQSDAATVDEYIEELEGDRKEAAKRLRQVLNETVPDLDESMDYGMPTYRKGDELYAFASQKQYMSLYVPDSYVMKAYANELGKVDLGKNCVRFRHLEDLDMEAVSRMLREMSEG